MIVYLGDLANHARVHRQIGVLRSEYEVTVASYAPPPEGVGGNWIRLSAGSRRSRTGSAVRAGLRLAGRYRMAYWRDSQAQHWREQLRAVMPADVIVVNQLYALPLAFEVGGGAPVVFDAHEHWTSESASWDWRSRISMRGAHDWIADTFVPRTSGMTTVSIGIARDFEQRTGTKPELVTNAPAFHALTPTPVHDPIRLLHFGMADERRRLEDTIEAVQSLGGGFTLDLILERENEYRRRLEQVAAKDERVRILPPVPSQQLLGVANDYDVGVFLLPARFPNQLHVLPNKLFDFIQARLAVAVGPSPEMAAIVERWDCGVVSSTFEPDSFAAALRSLTPESVERMKANSDRAAQVLNADANRETILSVVRQAIGARAANTVAPS